MKKINAGKQIKILAVVLAALIIAGGIYLSYEYAMETSYTSYGYYRTSETYLNGRTFWIGIAIFAITAYLTGIMLYGFGDLIETSAKSAENTTKLLESSAKTADNTGKLLEIQESTDSDFLN